MQFNQYTVDVTPGVARPGGYHELSHGQTYTLTLINHRRTRCDADVRIDGKSVGIWRIEALDTISLERPAHDTGRFTFYEVGTPEAASAGIATGASDNGLIQVIFTPELPTVARPLTAAPLYPPLYPSWPPYPWQPACRPWRPRRGIYEGGSLLRSCSAAPSLAAPDATFYLDARVKGATGLSGHSTQWFGQASPIQYDLSQQTTISVRLVGTRRDVPAVVDAHPHATPVPPPLR